MEIWIDARGASVPALEQSLADATAALCTETAALTTKMLTDFFPNRQKQQLPLSDGQDTFQMQQCPDSVVSQLLSTNDQVAADCCWLCWCWSAGFTIAVPGASAVPFVSLTDANSLVYRVVAAQEAVAVVGVSADASTAEGQQALMAAVGSAAWIHIQVQAPVSH